MRHWKQAQPYEAMDLRSINHTRPTSRGEANYLRLARAALISRPTNDAPENHRRMGSHRSCPYGDLTGSIWTGLIERITWTEGTQDGQAEELERGSDRRELAADRGAGGKA
jgi:hypothetical protein